MRSRDFIHVWLKWGLALLGAGLFVCSAQAAKLDGKRDELKSLREQIHALQSEIAKGEESRGEVADQLAESERAISGAQRRLREIIDERRAVEAELARLHAEQLRLEDQLALARKQLGTTLYRIYVEGGEAGARRMLGGKDPNQMSRDAFYLEQIARARMTAIEQARAALAQLEQVQADAETRRSELRALEAERTGEQHKLIDERNKHRAVLQDVAQRIRAQKQEVQTLQRNERRMKALLQGLERIARQRAAQARAAASSSKASTSRSASSIGAATQKSAGIAEQVAEPGDAVGNFTSLQGRLHWPVKGELFGRFGAQRSEGGIWRGVFIRAREGAEVRAIADGKVAYADWLRGFGNLVIIDHGNGYMSIYGNNDALFKTPGQSVRTGDVIASVGSSGGQEESGLYFELRHRGQPADPAKWMSTR